MIYTGNRESDFYKKSAESEEGLIGRIYSGDPIDVPPPAPATSTVDENAGKTDDKGKALKPQLKTIPHEASVKKKGRPSIFNRYELFYFDNFTNTPNGVGEPLFDSPNRLKDYISSARGKSHSETALKNPTAQNLINWSKNGGSASVEYDWPDFLWCKNYGKVPNNYMVTLRRFSVPASDDLFFKDKALVPDIARMITWVDGETNKWENAGLKFSTSLTWKKFESEIQSVNVGDSGSWGGGEGQALAGAGGVAEMIGNVATTLSKLFHPEDAAKQRSQGNKEAIDPYHDTMRVHGPVDIVKEMFVREKGINFEQTFTLTFEYELRSVDGINTKMAFMDLFSNVMMVVTNKAKWWGGEIKYWGGKGYRNVKPLGNPNKLAAGDYGGYIDSIMTNLSNGLNMLTKGEELFSKKGITNLLASAGGTILDGIVGGGLDKMGRPGAIAVNSLLSGEDTGPWHVMVGNPVNPIISVGNLIMEKADIEIDGPLGPDDFPNKLKVICTLKPARPRAREGIIDMFHRNGRTYTTLDPKKLSNVKTLTKKDPNTGPLKPQEKKKEPISPFNVSQFLNQNGGGGAGSGESKSANKDDAMIYRVPSESSDPFANHPNLYKERFSNWLTSAAEDTAVLTNTQGIF